MQLPISFFDVSVWLATTAIILLATSELLSLYRGKTNLPIERKRLKRVAFIVCVVFMFTVLVQMYWVISSP
jgi:hypothetical protein